MSFADLLKGREVNASDEARELAAEMEAHRMADGRGNGWRSFLDSIVGKDS